MLDRCVLMLNKYIAVFLLFITSHLAISQSCDLVLKGSLRDLDNNEELSFAVVKLIDQEKVMQTNEHGEFSATGLCRGNYKLLIQHFGCRDTIISFELVKSVKLMIRLPHSVNELSEVDVMDKRSEMKRTQVVTELTNEELQSTKGQSLGDILKTISGVTTLNTGATISKPMIHGMQGNRVLILNNGVRLEGQQWGNEHAPEIDPFVAKKISVIKGVNAIRYGSDAMAGVVLAEQDELPDTAAVTGELNVVGISNGRNGSASARLQGYFDRVKYFSWRVQGTVKKAGNVKTPEYYLDNTGMEEKNFSYALGYHRKKWGAEIYYSQFNAEIGIFRGSHIGNISDLQYALKYGKPVDSLADFSYLIDRPKQVVEHELIKGVSHYHFSPRWRALIQYAWQHNVRKEYDNRRLTAAERETEVVAPDLHLKVTTQTYEAIIEHDNIRSFRGMTGVNYLRQTNTYDGRFFIPNYINDTWGVFFTERYIMPHVEFEGGLRYDEKHLQSFYYVGKTWSNANRSFKNVTGNMGIIWKADSTFNVFFNAGSAWRAPAPNELYSNGIHQGVSSIERGDSSLKSETCYNVTLSGIYRKKKTNVEVTAYYNRFLNFIYLEPSNTTELTIRGAFPVFNYRQANVRIAGLDVKADYALSENLSVLIRGMIVRAWNYDINDYLIYMPGDRADVSVKYNFSKWKFVDDWYIQFNNSAVAKQWRVPVNTDFAPPPASYYLFGMNVGANFKWGRQTMYVNFGATNLLNKRYREYLDRFRYYSDAQGTSYNLRLTIPLVFYDKKQNQDH